MIVVKIRKQPSPLFGSSRRFVTCLSLWLCLAAAGCDSPSGHPSASSATPRTEKLKTNLSAEEARQIAQPITNTPGLSVETTAAQNQAIGNEAYASQMNPAMGIKTKRLFDTRAESDDERFERLEAAVQALRDDFDKASPSINRLMAIEQEIQTLVDQLQTLVGENGGAADVPIPPVSAQLLEDNPAEPTTMPPLPPDAQAMQDAQKTASAPSEPVPLSPPSPAPTIAQPSTSAPATVTPPAPAQSTAPSVSSGVALTALRIGDHEKTTRIVFEASGKVDYSVDVDPEKILLINFVNGASQLSDAQLKSKSDMIKSIDVTPQNNGGLIVAMSLSKLTTIVRHGILPPDAENQNYRLYIDIAR